MRFALLYSKKVFHILESRITEAVSAHIRIRYGVEVAVVVEQPRQSSFGEIALPVAFQLAKELKRAPRAIAAELAEELPPIEGVQKLEAAGGGYLNLRFERAWYGGELLKPPAAMDSGGEKIIVEHTNINPNKAAHIGHLRNAILGDTFVRMLRAAGRNVEVQNYIDNTGVQVADVVVAFHFLEKKTYAEVEALSRAERFDYLCWDLYARMSGYYKDNAESLQWRHETLHAIESGSGEIAALAHLIADAIVNAHVRTMLRLGIVYDVLPRESEILHLHFWATAFEQLKARKAIYFETEGKNKGCWVMPGSSYSDDAAGDDSKVIVRSNGIVTYVGKDIAYQLWKFGLLGKDFHYRVWSRYEDGHLLYVSTDKEGENVTFGKASRVYNVIDSRQSYLQDVVQAGLRALGYNKEAENSVHFAYEMVALTPRTCVELGIELSEEDKAKSYVEVSGRKGLGVKADDLIDKLIESASREVDSRHKELPLAGRRKSATSIAIAALRYFMLKFTRSSVIAFDFQEALSFEGETGPYVQYACVRARNILRKSGTEIPPMDGAALGKQLADEQLWQFALSASRADWAVDRALQSGEPSHVARFAFQLAQAFNNFYHEYKVLAEEDVEKRAFLLWLTDYFRSQLERTLGILGITVPEFM